MDESCASDLATWLASTSDSYVVAKTLKDTPSEVTEVVYARDSMGTPTVGPFVRKRFDKDTGRGGAYEQLLKLQTSGTRLAHQPLIYACTQVGSFFEVVMEYVPGVTLLELAKWDGAGFNLAARVMPDLCDAVSELHEFFAEPLIHRDVKPSNVMVANDRVVLIDLGIARTYQHGAARDTVRYGTPGYAPPEQFGYGQTSIRSDVYALGMTLAFCLTGEEPTPELHESKFVDPQIPPALRDVLVRATEFDPERRHPTVRALRADFDRAVAELYGTAAPTHKQPTASLPSWRERHVAQLNTLGIIWNIVLGIIWCLMAFSCVANLVHPNEETASLPLWFAILEYVGLLFVPWSLGTYLLWDKRRLRSHEPFSRWTWRVELPFCLIGALASMIFVVVLYNQLFS